MKRVSTLLLIAGACNCMLDPDSVPPPKPSAFMYPNDPVVYRVGQPIGESAPVKEDATTPVSSYQIAPPLPQGLIFDTATGVISGTPLALSPATSYAITATNPSGSTLATLGITVLGLQGAVSSGRYHNCALSGGGAVCWGRNTHGGLGNNTDAGSSVPVHVFGLGSGVQAVAAGGYHACAIADGGALCWGWNSDGQLGNGSSAQESRVPVQVTGLTSGVQAISAGVQHTCAIVGGGAVVCWGRNNFGQLGTGNTTDSTVPVPVSGLASGVQALTTGDYHTCAILDGGVLCWGAGYTGELGHPSNATNLTPNPPTGISSGVQDISAGGDHTCAVVNGSALCWGLNDAGELGDGTINTSFAPIQVSGLTAGVLSTAAGDHHTCANVNGSAWCWGEGASGQLGNGAGTASRVPVPVAGLTSGIQGITTGYDSSCASTPGGVVCWGVNLFGELGNNSTTDSWVPVAVFSP
ncbi:MAG TPA: putative Ig domain-containing protein [Myxococcaceae bacterium]|nr:putative Ig domain-containing protein [Myxococcaceae bacterium]